jgi:acylphosphatase
MNGKTMFFGFLLNFPVIIYSTSIYDDSIPLSILDKRIIKGMTDPQKDKGQDLLNDAYNYYNILDDIEILMKNKDPEGVQRIEALVKEGGPKFINQTMIEDDLYHYYKWDPSEFNELRATIQGTKRLYNRLVKMLQNMKSKKSGVKNVTEKSSEDESWSF